MFQCWHWVIAKQVEMITNENFLLRKELNDVNIALKSQADETAIKIIGLMDLLAEKEKMSYRADMELKNLEKGVETLKNEVEKEKSKSDGKNLEIKNLEKENIVLSTILEIMKPKEKKD